MRALLQRPFLLVFLAVFFAALYQYGAVAKNYAVYGLPVGASAASKLACSFYFVTGRDADQIKTEDLGPLDPVLALFDVDYNEDTGVVTADAFGLLSRRAQYRPSFGCTAIPEGRESLPELTLERERPDVADFEIAAADSVLAAAVERELQSADTRAVLVLRDGQLAAEGYADDFDADSKLLAWSVAKSMTATAVGVLIERGVLSLEQDHLLPEWADDARASIKLIDLLQMSSGLDFDEIYGPGSDATNMLFVESDMSSFVARSALLAEPGTQFNYSSGTTVLLMRIIKDTLASSDDYFNFIYRDVLDKVGMVDTIFEPDASDVFVGSSFLYATPYDFARFGQFYLQLAQGGQSDILPDDWYQTISTPAKSADEGQYGAQFWLNTEGTRFAGVPKDALMSLGHNGQVVAVLPTQNVVLVRLGWSTDGVFKPEHFISRMLEAL